MVDLMVRRDIDAGIEKVWAILEDFGNIDWIPSEKTVEVIGSGLGMIRRIHIPDLPPIDEILQSMDSGRKTLSYTIPRNVVIPFDDFAADVALSSTGANGTHIDWHSSFDAGAMPEAEAIAMMEGFYAMILDGLVAASCR